MTSKMIADYYPHGGLKYIGLNNDTLQCFYLFSIDT